MFKIAARSVFLIVLIYCVPLRAMVDNHHFYRASNFLPQISEPRLECYSLATYDVLAGYGATRKARNPCNLDCSTTGLFQIYGLQDMTNVILGVPNIDPTDPAQLAFIELAALPNSNPLFGRLAFSGRFSITEVNLIGSQNFGSSWFAQVHLPIRVLTLSKICIEDLTPTANALTVAQTPEWVAAKKQLPTLLSEFGLCIPDELNEHGPGDTTILVGWTYSYVDSMVFDFVDTTLRTGVLIPTGSSQNANIPVDIIPNGYNGHTAIPLAVDFAFGALEWLTLGMHAGALLFFNTTRDLRIFTDPTQVGLIKLTKVRATIDRGVLWAIGAFVEADHFARGLSLLVGYTAAIQRPSQITKAQCCTKNAPINLCIANQDCALLGWKMHTIQFRAEYDFATWGSRWGARMAVFFNKQVAGTRVLRTDVGGGNIGMDIQWIF